MKINLVNSNEAYKHNIVLAQYIGGYYSCDWGLINAHNTETNTMALIYQSCFKTDADLSAELVSQQDTQVIYETFVELKELVETLYGRG